MNNKKIVYLGTPLISAQVLEGIIDAGFNIVAVISQPRHKMNRKKELLPTPVEEIALKHNIKCFQPERLNKEFEFLHEVDFDILLTMAYGQIISSKVLALSKLPPLNVHGSLLPKYRGAAPIQYAIRHGEKQTGVTLMRMVKEMDAGDMYATEAIDISPEETYSSLCDKMVVASLELLKKNLPLFFEDKLVGVAQDESLVTFCPSISKEEEKINFFTSAISCANQIKSLSLLPGAYCFLDDEILKIYAASATSYKTDNVPGTIIKAEKDIIEIATLEGTILVSLLQKPGKKMMTARDFNNGDKSLCGKILK